MSMFEYKGMYVDIYAKYYDESEKTIVRREVPLDVALLMIEYMLAMKKMQWMLYNAKIESMHVIEWVRME